MLPIILPPYYRIFERYMVVWQHELTNGEHDIVGRELDGNATPGDLVTFVSWLGDDTAPDVARSSFATEGIVIGDYTAWLVVWQHKTLTGWAVWGFQKGPLGTEEPFVVSSYPNWDAERPTLALSADHRLLITYEGDSAGDPTVDRHIYARLEWPGGLTTYVPMVVRGS
jgi:hypothetical protein